MRFFLSAWLLAATLTARADPIILRVGHFPNITHAQGVIGHALTQQGKGWFEKRLGPDVKIEWFVYNAGPSAMEAIFAGSIDLTYVGPSPALNAYVKSEGEEIRIIGGAAEGGAALVVQSDGRIKVPGDFKGKKVATPQFGNTQDVECRSWLTAQGLHVTQHGGDVLVVPTENPDQLTLFSQGTIDGVWTVEPWVSRLVNEAQGKIFLEQKDTITTVLVSSAKFLHDHRELAKKFAQANAELTDWINKNPTEAQQLMVDEFAKLNRPMKPAFVAAAWDRLRFTPAITLPPLERFVKDAQAAGFLHNAPDLKRFIEIP